MPLGSLAQGVFRSFLRIVTPIRMLAGEAQYFHLENKTKQNKLAEWLMGNPSATTPDHDALCYFLNFPSFLLV